jgi:energy-coupling factor transporter ATP-binding protein EcfA2
VVVIQHGKIGRETDALSKSAVVTCKKFVDGSDRTQYDTIIVLVEDSGFLRLTQVIENTHSDLSKPIFELFPEVIHTLVGQDDRSSVRQNPTAGSSFDLELSSMTKQFVRACSNAQLLVSDRDSLRLLTSLLCKKFVIATGLSGSGKTKLAQALAAWLGVESSDVRLVAGAKIAASNTTYHVRRVDENSIEVWNSTEESTAEKIVLPKALISEWVEAIHARGFDRHTPSKEMQDAAQQNSLWSNQLHSFHSPLKAISMSIVEAGPTEEPRRTHLLLPVGADWTGNDRIVGYPDGLDAGRYVSTAALELILDAAENQDTPYFLILDEMNLSHVERYFADFLSAIESGEKIPLYEGTERTSNGRQIPNRINLPTNLFVIGTVNVDETTYMFSPKVLDRANVIEFRMEREDIAAFLDSPAKPRLEELAGKGADHGKAFVQAANCPATVPEEVTEVFKAEFLHFFELLQRHHAEYGYRTGYEAARFIRFYKELGGFIEGDDDWFTEAMDCVIVQKLLPKLHGSQTKLKPLLIELWRTTRYAPEARLAAEAKDEPKADQLKEAHYPLSAEKVYRMWKQLHMNGFASFAEA